MAHQRGQSIADHMLGLSLDTAPTEFKGADLKTAFNRSQQENIANSFLTNDRVTHVDMSNCEINTEAALIWAEVIEKNPVITHLDLGYNKIGPDGIIAIAKSLAKNTTLQEFKIHRQETDYGLAAEEEICKIWDTNTTLRRLYCTLHDRRCNQINTKNEVRNQSIAKRIADGKPWDDLNPATREAYFESKAREEKAKAEAEAKANAPISAKVASTGGPYTYKQLTCAKEFLPDDVDPKNLVAHLAQDEFPEVFGMSKTEFDALAGWKKTNLKKAKKLF